MRILLVNDDGYDMEGIRALDEALSSFSHEVLVVAPSSNRSAQSHAMNLRGPVTLTKYGENRYHCSGSPTDCIIFAMKSNLFEKKPDLVISGINHGYNCSSDILYSGTCSAASEAVLQKVKGIAVSHQCDAEGRYEFSRVADFVARHLDKLILLTGEDSFVNLNFPPDFREEVEVAALGKLFYGDVVETVSKADDVTVFRLKEGDVARDILRKEEKTDVEVCDEGKIALSVVMVNPEIDREAHERARELFL